MRCLLLLGILLFCCWPVCLPAHNLETGQALLTLSPDRVWILELEINLTRYILSNPGLAESVRPEFRALEKEGALNGENFKRWETVFSKTEVLFRTELEVFESGTRLDGFEMWFPHPSELPEASYGSMASEGLHIKVHATGKMTDDQSTLQFRFPPDAGEVILTAVRPEVQWVVTGELSEPISVFGSEHFQSEGQGTGSTVVRFVKIGFKHIVPKGLDHILFVLGLFLLVPKLRPLLVQVTAFTLAHTLTLGLSIYGVVSLPSSVVEPLIALSIALVALENVLTDRIHPWRPVLVFLFGLLHGLGFAGVLVETGLPQDRFLWALVSFNLGVELGQLAVLITAFLVLGLFIHREWYRSRLTIPASVLVGLTGLYWAVQRVLF